MLVMGIDLGTSGARAMVVDQGGVVCASARRPVKPKLAHPLGWAEQDPLDWLDAVTWAVRTALLELTGKGHTAEAIAAVSVTSTSGTMVLLDEAGRPVRPAILYNDARAWEEAREIDAAGRESWARLGYRMTASFGLPKLLWVMRHEPQVWAATRFAVHAADFLAGNLTSEPGVSDASNALKTGYDLVDLRWPEAVLGKLGLDVQRFPRVVRAGEALGSVSKEASATTGLPVGIPVVAGMTDGCASQIATGAVAPGDWSTTIGSTLVVKGVTRELLSDPSGAVYSHRHPEGFWMPGGASNTGGLVLADRFGRERLADLGESARIPTDLLVYPLAVRGERFPFAHPDAEGFVMGEPRDEAEMYAAHLEGIAYVERLAYEVLGRLGADVSGAVAASGGGAGSPLWLQIRADVLNRPVVLPETPEAAFGAAVLAVGHISGQGLIQAARGMVRAVATYEPRSAQVRAYAERYGRFVTALSERGYI